MTNHIDHPDLPEVETSAKQIQSLRNEISYHIGGLNKFFNAEDIKKIDALMEDADISQLAYLAELLEKTNRAWEIYELVRKQAMISMTEPEEAEPKTGGERKITKELLAVRESALDFLEDVKRYLAESSAANKKKMNKEWQLFMALAGGNKELMEKKLRFLSRQKKAAERAPEIVKEAEQLSRERAEQERLEQEAFEREERELQEVERLESERQEAERLEEERQAEAGRLAAERRVEQERAAQAERERIERERTVMPAWKQAGLDGRGRYRVDILARKIREGLINVNQLAGANLCRARVSRADLRDADLHGANLFGANLFGADLFKADLRGADLRGANLTEATVDEANLTNAKLEGAICYTSDDLPESIRHDFDENGRYHAAVPASEPINPENLPPETIFVRNAKNPFREAFVDGGVVAPERKDAVWNLVEKCHEDMAVYQDCEIESWARNLAGRENKLRNLSAEKKRIIESEIAEGAIPIIMPGKRVQLETTIEQIKMLRPKFKNEDGVETLANESNLSWSHLKQLIAQRDALLVSGIPDGPYILLMKPTQKSELRGKTMGAQRAEIAAINENRSAERKIYAINLYEYAAAQTIRSKMIINRSEAGRTELSQVRPMDFDYKAYTRFVSLNVPGGLVPCGRWHSVQHKLDFDSVNAVERGPFLGVRLVLRLEI